MIVSQHGWIADIAARAPLAALMISSAQAAAAPSTIRPRCSLARGTEGGLSVVPQFPSIRPCSGSSIPTLPLRRRITALARCSMDRSVPAQYVRLSRLTANV
jgi:hypothetical protein